MSSSDTSTTNPKRNVLFSVLQSVSAKQAAICRIKLLNVSRKNTVVYYSFLQQLFYITLQSLHGFPCGGSLTRSHQPLQSRALPSPAEHLSFSAPSLWLQLCPVTSDHTQSLAPGLLSHQALLHTKARLQA